MNKQETRDAILTAFQAQGKEIFHAGRKGDGFFIQGYGFVKFNDARKMAGIAAHTSTPRVARPRVGLWGDYAVIASLNGIRID